MGNDTITVPRTTGVSVMGRRTVPKRLKPTMHQRSLLRLYFGMPECLRPTPTIVRAALQQQAVFIQVTELPHADEVVVHSRNLALSGLPSGACKTSTLSDVASPAERAISPLSRVGGEAWSEAPSNRPAGRRFDSKHCRPVAMSTSWIISSAGTTGLWIH